MISQGKIESNNIHIAYIFYLEINSKNFYSNKQNY